MFGRLGLLCVALSLVLSSPAQAEKDSILNIFKSLTDDGIGGDDSVQVEKAITEASKAPGQSITWENSATAHSGSVTVIGTYKNSDGDNCSSYRRITNTGVDKILSTGNACRQMFGWVASGKERVEFNPKDKTAEPKTVTPQKSTSSVASTPKQPSASKHLVQDTQAALAKLGFDPGPADGLYGGKTRRAIEDYQRKHGISVNGRVTPLLLSNLQADVEKSAATPAVKWEATPKPATPLQVTSDKTAASTPQTAQVLTPDYCGPAGKKILSLAIPDEALGPFSGACKAHDECYAEAGKSIIGTLKASDGSIDDRQVEGTTLFEVEQVSCDQQFLTDLKASCQESQPDKGDGWFRACNRNASRYFVAVRKHGANAFNNAVIAALEDSKSRGVGSATGSETSEHKNSQMNKPFLDDKEEIKEYLWKLTSKTNTYRNSIAKFPEDKKVLAKEIFVGLFYNEGDDLTQAERNLAAPQRKEIGMSDGAKNSPDGQFTVIRNQEDIKLEVLEENLKLIVASIYKHAPGLYAETLINPIPAKKSGRPKSTISPYDIRLETIDRKTVSEFLERGNSNGNHGNVTEQIQYGMVRVGKWIKNSRIEHVKKNVYGYLFSDENKSLVFRKNLRKDLSKARIFPLAKSRKRIQTRSITDVSWHFNERQGNNSTNATRNRENLSSKIFYVEELAHSLTSICPKVRFQTDQYGRKTASKESCKVKIAKWTFSDIIGIRSTNGKKTVEYRVKSIPTEIGQSLKFDQIGITKERVVTFLKYDDGWRLQRSNR